MMAQVTETPTTFDPSNFFSDYTQFNPFYTTDTSASSQRLNLLQQALSYIQSNPSGMSPADQQFYTQQLNQDIAEQQNVGNYDTSVTGLNNLTNELSAATAYASGKLSSTPGSYDTSNWGVIQQYAPQLAQWLSTQQQTVQNNMNPNQNPLNGQDANAILSYIQGANTSQNPMISTGQLQQFYNQYLIPTLQAQQASLQGNQNTNLSQLMNNIAITSPNFQNEIQQLQDYYFGTDGKGGAVAQATQPEIQDIYQQNYNLRQGINSQMAAAGNLESGVRQKALADQNAMAVTTAANAVSNANNQANQAINNAKQNNASTQAQQTDLLNSLKNGGASNLLSGASNSAVQNYQTNTATQLNNNLQQGETNLTNENANNLQEGSIFGTLGGAAGSAAGNATASNPFGVFASQQGALV